MSKSKSPLSGLKGGSNKSSKIKDKDPPTVADKLLAIINQKIVELFEDQYNNPHAVVKIDDRLESIPIPATLNNGGLFKKWICKAYYDSTQRLMSNTDAVTAVCNHLTSKA